MKPMIHDDMRPRAPGGYDDIGDGDDDLHQDAASAIWREDIFRADDGDTTGELTDPVARFKDRLRRAASERRSSPRDDEPG
jgi:hypothetical protein